MYIANAILLHFDSSVYINVCDTKILRWRDSDVITHMWVICCIAIAIVCQLNIVYLIQLSYCIFLNGICVNNEL